MFGKRISFILTIFSFRIAFPFNVAAYKEIEEDRAEDEEEE